MGTKEMRQVHEEGVSDLNIHLVDVYNAKKIIIIKKWSPGRHFPPSFPHVSLAPKNPLSLPFEMPTTQAK